MHQPEIDMYARATRRSHLGNQLTEATAGLATTRRMLFAPKVAGAESQASNRPEKRRRWRRERIPGRTNPYQSVTIVITGVFAGRLNGYHGRGS
jgi:hypothetical protein